MQNPQEIELEITVDHRSMIGKKLPMIGGKAGFSTWKKQGKSCMTANHRDQELWERYFKPWGNRIKWKTVLYL
jgi:hypothetical protein